MCVYVWPVMGTQNSSHTICDESNTRALRRGESSHHATTEVGLEFFRIHVHGIQNVKLVLGTVQNSLTVQHALLKVSRLLE